MDSWSKKLLTLSNTWCEDLTHLKRPWWWERLKAGGKGATEDETVGWHHRLNGHEFEQTPGVGDGQGGLACCSSWGRRFGHDWMTNKKSNRNGPESWNMALQKKVFHRYLFRWRYGDRLARAPVQKVSGVFTCTRITVNLKNYWFRRRVIYL